MHKTKEIDLDQELEVELAPEVTNFQDQALNMANFRRVDKPCSSKTWAQINNQLEISTWVQHKDKTLDKAILTKGLVP